MLIEGGKMS